MPRKDMARKELNKEKSGRKIIDTPYIEMEKTIHETLRIARIGLWEMDLVNNILIWSKTVLDLFEIDSEDYKPTYEAFLQFVHPEDREYVDQYFKDSHKLKTTCDLTHRLLLAGDRIKWITETWRTYHDKQDNPLRSVGTVQDITEIKQTDLALMESERRYHTILQSAIDGYWLVDMQSRLLEVNKAYCKMSGYTEQELLKMHIFDLEAIENEEEVYKRRDKILKQGADRFESRHRRKDGSEFDVEVSIKYSPDNGGQYAVFLRDITAHKKAQEALLESDIRLKKLSDHVPGMIYQFVRRTDGSYCVPFASEAICDIFGCTPEVVRDDFTPAANVVFHEDIQKLVDSIEDSARRLAPWKCEYRVQVPGRPIRWMFGQSTPEKLEDGSIIWHGFNMDITEQKNAEEEKAKLEEQLRQAQKMESVGRLAGGVAHDFNNMLGVIIGHSDMALNEVTSSHPLYQSLEEIRTAASRSADLTRQLLAFARKQTIAPKILNLNSIISGMLKMLNRLIGEEIDLSWVPGDDLWSVKVDPSQIDQILANLCINARDAIANVGKITIETSNCHFDEDYVASHAGYETGNFVMLAVSDSGCGIDKKTLENIFEPFYTTKKMGEGTGLGLSTVYGAVKQNDGFINVYSDPGYGATFKVYLPRFEGSIEQKRKKQAGRNIRQGNETILLVEDELSILKMTRSMLESQGYKVLAASMPSVAVRLAREYDGQIDLLMTDVVMPEMNGPELARKLLEIFSDLKCLYNSGYTANVIAHRGVLDEGLHFIHKPFSLKELSEKLREVLDN